MAYTDYSALLINHSVKTIKGMVLSGDISAIVIGYLVENSYGRFETAYAARKVIHVLSFKPSAKIFLYNGDFHVVDIRTYSVLKSFVSFVCSLDFDKNNEFDIDIDYIKSYFNWLVKHYNDHYGFVLNPAPLPDIVNSDLPF